MRLLPLLLAILAVDAFNQDRFSSFRDKSKLRKKGILSEEKKLKLANFIGNLDRKRANLDRIQAKRHVKQMTEEEKASVAERVSKLIPIQTERPNENEAVDLFEVNDREGISDFLYQGDIDLTDFQAAAVEKEAEANPYARVKRQATSVFPKWAGGNVYFYFDPSVNARKKASVAAAHQWISSRTCINFIESSTATNRIKVFSDAGCYATIGMVGGEQTLSLGDGCEVIGTAAHEFSHSLGFFHTQMRSDRDTYVTIDTTYVDPTKTGNFDKLAAADNFIYTPYEYGSFMHYGSNSFTNPNDKLSIVPKDMRYAYTMGNRQISFYDILMINMHYQCDAACPAATSAQCKNGGKPNPRNCAKCNCPLGYDGTLCDQLPVATPACGELLAATATWQAKTFKFGDQTDNTNVRDVFTMCYHWIQAPVGFAIEVRITSMFNPQCQYGCPFNGIELKTDSTDPKMTNPRYCCPEFNNQIFTSTVNPMPVISFNRYYYTEFTIEYRTAPMPATTVAPTTAAPTTAAPTTAAPTTVAPTTAAPTTVAPATTKAPTTVAPTTVAPTTVAPTTVAPTTVAPTTAAPTTAAPTTAAPTTAAPTTAAPTTAAPTTAAPTTVAPTTVKINKCKSMNAANCPVEVAKGFCTNASYSWAMRKYNCAIECGMCGQAAPVCEDRNGASSCAAAKAQGLCARMDPMQAEYNCALSCGFCTNPN